MCEMKTKIVFARQQVVQQRSAETEGGKEKQGGPFESLQKGKIDADTHGSERPTLRDGAKVPMRWKGWSSR